MAPIFQPFEYDASLCFRCCALTFVLSLQVDPVIYCPLWPFDSWAPILNVSFSLAAAFWHLHRKCPSCTALISKRPLVIICHNVSVPEKGRIPPLQCESPTVTKYTITNSIFSSPFATVMKWKCWTIMCSRAQCFPMSRQCECIVKSINYL